eukprot:827775_1
MYISRLVVCGYTRETLSATAYIPTKIVQICCLFYKPLFKIFLYSRTDRRITVLHVQKQRVSKMCLSPLDKLSFSKPMCYIHRISLGMRIEPDNVIDLYPNKSYDAVLCIERNKSYYYPTLLLFKSSKIENKFINCIPFTSNKPLPVDRTTVGYSYGAHDPIYCGPTHGIIYAFDGELYQLKLSSVDTTTKQYSFAQINAKPTHFWDHISHHDHPQYLSMTYLKHNDAIFSMKCDWKKRKWSRNNVKCAIFDLMKSEWKSIADLEYKHQEITGYYAQQTCYNPFDSNSIYCVSTTGNTAKYDFRKNKWDILWHNDDELALKSKNRHVVWMDAPNMLCYSNGTDFGYLDCRNNKPKWNELPEMNTNAMHSNGLSVFL